MRKVAAWAISSAVTALILAMVLQFSDLLSYFSKYAVIIGTNAPLRPTIELRVGYGAVLAGDIAAQIDAYIQ